MYKKQTGLWTLPVFLNWWGKRVHTWQQALFYHTNSHHTIPGQKTQPEFKISFAWPPLVWRAALQAPLQLHRSRKGDRPGPAADNTGWSPETPQHVTDRDLSQCIWRDKNIDSQLRVNNAMKKTKYKTKYKTAAVQKYATKDFFKIT